MIRLIVIPGLDHKSDDLSDACCSYVNRVVEGL